MRPEPQPTVKIIFNGTWSQANHDIFVAAANQLTSIIAGEIPNVSVRSRGTVTQVDDITITAELGAIDGPGGTICRTSTPATRFSADFGGSALRPPVAGGRGPRAR